MVEQLSLLDVPPVEPPKRVHHCHAIGCEKEVLRILLMCRKHWRMVPKDLRDEVNRTYKFGQEVDKVPSPEYMAAAKAAIEAVHLAENPPPKSVVPELPTPEAPISVRFSAGDRVSIKPITCQGRTIHPWKSKAGTLKGLEGDTALVDFGVPGHPYPCRSDRLCEPTEAMEVPSEPAPIKVFSEWRWWESTQRWTYTGRMGLSIKPSHPNSKVFPYGVDPNEEMSQC
ncbi:MAG: hypothetical protein AAF215_05490 [Cyanobacteria bacterium P01_A01_bin.123]